VFPLRDGSALALTTARYLTPKLRDIDRKGISPDITIEQAKQDFIPPLSEKDVQAASAIKELRQEMRSLARAG
jgi:carboxyl-terminal processing protease